MIWLCFLLGYLVVIFIALIICMYRDYADSSYYELRQVSEFFEWYVETKDFPASITTSIFWPISLIMFAFTAITSVLIESIFNLLDKIFNRGAEESEH